MNIREALLRQAPSLALLRAANDEIARLDSQLNRLNSVLSDRQIERIARLALSDMQSSGWNVAFAKKVQEVLKDESLFKRISEP
jgi:hypothetical protein